MLDPEGDEVAERIDVNPAATWAKHEDAATGHRRRLLEMVREARRPLRQPRREVQEGNEAGR